MPKAKPKAASKGQRPSQVLDITVANAAAQTPEGFKTTRIITLPVVTIKVPGEGKVLKIMDAMRISKVEGKKGADGKPQKPATICTVTDAQTGEMGIYLVGAVVQSNLERDYHDGDYVGKTFHIVNLGKRSDSQRYADYRISEVEAK